MRTPWHVCVLLVVATAAIPADAARNVLMLMCHDLGPRIGPYAEQLVGEAVADTPALDGLAARGVTFDNAFCQLPVGGPSRLSTLSGLYPETTGALRPRDVITETLPDAPSLPRTLKRAGYWTASAGRVYPRSVEDGDRLNWSRVVRHPNEELPIVRRARERFVAEHGPFDRPGTRVLWRQTLQSLATQTRGERVPGFGPSGLGDFGHADGRNAQQVVEWIDSRSWGDKPFFIALGFRKPHVPFVVPEAYFDRYDPATLTPKLPVARSDDPSATFAISKRYRAFGFEYGREDVALRQAYTQAYLACVSFVDAQIGRVLESVDTAGLTDDTLIIFVSDNGLLLGEQFLWGKDMLVDRCVNVPLIISDPTRGASGERASGIVELIDLFPTVCEWCGVATPEGLTGREITGLIRDPKGTGRDAAYSVVTRGSLVARSIRTPDWRYTEWDGSEFSELLDCRADAERVQNLVAQQEFSDTVASLRRRLQTAGPKRLAERGDASGTTATDWPIGERVDSSAGGFARVAANRSTPNAPAGRRRTAHLEETR